MYVEQNVFYLETHQKADQQFEVFQEESFGFFLRLILRKPLHLESSSDSKNFLEECFKLCMIVFNTSPSGQPPTHDTPNIISFSSTLPTFFISSSIRKADLGFLFSGGAEHEDVLLKIVHRYVVYMNFYRKWIHEINGSG